MNSLQLEQAAALNHSELFCLNALSQGGEVKTIEGLTWTYGGEGKGSMVPFPSLTDENVDRCVDAMMAYYREHDPKNAGCWSLNPPQPLDLGIKLLARGFQPGWQPCWMALDLDNIKTDYAFPITLLVKADNHTDINNEKNLPYAGDNGAVSQALMQKHPERAQRFIAYLNGKIVGHSCVFFGTGEAAAGIYNVGVKPAMRQQGIGKAVVIAACAYAKEKGYHYATLNATGRRMYEQIGFRWINSGLTWWLNERFRTHPPSTQQIAFAEAIGKGDINLLNDKPGQFASLDINERLASGMTPMELAVRCRQMAMAEWLVEHGAVCNVLQAWDLGWKDRAAGILKKDPAQANALYGDLQISLLHTAVDRNDIALAALALSAKPDLTAKDGIYKSTALDWANYLKTHEIGEMIKKVSSE